MSVHPLPQIAAFLLPHDARAVIDIFRQVDRFRGDYESSALAGITSDLARTMPCDIAEGHVSDALLIDAELRSRGQGHPICFPPGAPTASVSEAALLNLIAGMMHSDYCAAAEAAIALEVMQARVLFSLTFRFGQRLNATGISLLPRSIKGTIAPAIPAANRAHPSQTRLFLRLVHSAE